MVRSRPVAVSRDRQLCSASKPIGSGFEEVFNRHRGAGGALVVSNVAWAFNAFDVGISRSYERASYDVESDALTRALAVIPVAAKERSSKEEIVGAARRKGDTVDVFEKDGVTWIGNLGLRFEATGRVVKACAASCSE
jgi:hypothetical protein